MKNEEMWEIRKGTHNRNDWTRANKVTLKAGLGMRLWKSSHGEVMSTGTAHFFFSSGFSFGFIFSSFLGSEGAEDDTAS